MSLNTTTVSAWDDALATDYNNLRKDVIEKSWDRAVTTWSANAYVLSTDTQITAYVASQRYVFQANFTNTWSPTLNVNAIWAKTIKDFEKNELIAWDIPSWSTIETIYDWTDLIAVNIHKRGKFWWDSSDWDISGALTITWSNDTYIVKNYKDFTPWSNTVTITPTNCILHLKVRWNCDLTNTTFDFQGKWATAWTGWIGDDSSWANWASGNDGFTTNNFHLANKWILWGWASGWVWIWGASSIIDYIIKSSLFQASRNIAITPWAWWGWGWAGQGQISQTAWDWGTWWIGGWAVILEVAWNLTFSSTTIDFDWVIWSNWTNWSGWNVWWWWWWWWGWGWMFICLYNWILTWSNTPTIAWWAGGSWWTGQWSWNEWWGWASGWVSGAWNSTAWSNWSNPWGWSWWAWKEGLFIIEKNTVFD